MKQGSVTWDLLPKAEAYSFLKAQDAEHWASANQSLYCREGWAEGLWTPYSLPPQPLPSCPTLPMDLQGAPALHSVDRLSSWLWQGERARRRGQAGRSGGGVGEGLAESRASQCHVWDHTDILPECNTHSLVRLRTSLNRHICGKWKGKWMKSRSNRRLMPG